MKVAWRADDHCVELANLSCAERGQDTLARCRNETWQHWLPSRNAWIVGTLEKSGYDGAGTGLTKSGLSHIYDGVMNTSHVERLTACADPSHVTCSLNPKKLEPSEATE